MKKVVSYALPQLCARVITISRFFLSFSFLSHQVGLLQETFFSFACFYFLLKFESNPKRLRLHKLICLTMRKRTSLRGCTFCSCDSLKPDSLLTGIVFSFHFFPVHFKFFFFFLAYFIISGLEHLNFSRKKKPQPDSCILGKVKMSLRVHQHPFI